MAATLPPIPPNSDEQFKVAMTEAWTAAFTAKRLLDENNISTAVAWADAARMWATIATATYARS